MRTYSHGVFTWVVARYIFRAGPTAARAGAIGAVLPDLPAIVGVAYLSARRRELPGVGMSHDELHERFLDAVYSTGPFFTAGSLLHSLVPAATVLAVYLLFFRRRDPRRVVLWFVLGWAAHGLTDLLTHAHDGWPPLWPLSGWRWQSPVSYWDPEYYGQEFALLEHGALLLVILLILVSRRFGASKLRRRRRR